jgi:hypothetical protein
LGPRTFASPAATSRSRSSCSTSSSRRGSASAAAAAPLRCCASANLRRTPSSCRAHRRVLMSAFAGIRLPVSFQSSLTWDSIKPVSAFALNFNRPLELTIKPPPRWGGWQAPLTFSEPVSQPYRVALSPCIRSHQREIRKWQSLTSGERVAAHGGVEAEGIQRHRADA